jgi:hypothetical protein
VGTEEAQSLQQGLEVLDAEETLDDGGTTFEQLFAFLLEKEDIIITIDSTEQENVRRGMSVVKHNYTKRMKNAGNLVEEKQIKYRVLDTEDDSMGQVRMQIWLESRRSVRIHKIAVSDKEL